MAHPCLTRSQRRRSSEPSPRRRWLRVKRDNGNRVRYINRRTSLVKRGEEKAYKSFPVQEDEHFYAVCRYVERNALRANLAARGAVAMVQSGAETLSGRAWRKRRDCRTGPCLGQEIGLRW